MEMLRDLGETVLGLGRNPQELGFVHVSARALLVFFIALVLVRCGDKRFLSKKTAFDAILGFMLASMLARAINGSAAFWPTLVGGLTLVALHRLLAYSSRRWHSLGRLIKGSCDLVIRDGKVVKESLHKNDLSEQDLLEDLRLHGKVEHVSEVKAAYVERNGEVSVVPREK